MEKEVWRVVWFFFFDIVVGVVEFIWVWGVGLWIGMLVRFWVIFSREGVFFVLFDMVVECDWGFFMCWLWFVLRYWIVVILLVWLFLSFFFKILRVGWFVVILVFIVSFDVILFILGILEEDILVLMIVEGFEYILFCNGLDFV